MRNTTQLNSNRSGLIEGLKGRLRMAMETAVNFMMDGRPTTGESVVVFDQGVVGLLITTLLAQYPLGVLATLDQSTIRL